MGFCPAQEKGKWKAKGQQLGLAAAACLALSLFNPYGYDILFFPFRLVFDTYLMDHIIEFLSPDFHQTMPFRYLLYLTIGIFGLSKTQLSLIELMLILLITHMALYSARYIPLFGVIAAPILLRQAELWLEHAGGRWMDHFKRVSQSLASADGFSRGRWWMPLAVVGLCFLGRHGQDSV
jgi:hypothetical protein